MYSKNNIAMKIDNLKRPNSASRYSQVLKSDLMLDEHEVKMRMCRYSYVKIA